MTGSAPAAQSSSVAIVLVNWNGWRDTIECIDTVMTQDHRPFHIYVVDNDSSDDSVAEIGRWCDRPVADPGWARHVDVLHWSELAESQPISHRILEPMATVAPAPPECRITLIRSAVNLGFAGGCNLAVRVAERDAVDYFWFLNNDTVIATDALSTLLERNRSEPRPGVTGSTILYYDAPHRIQAMGGALMDFRTGTSRHIGAGALASELPMSPSGVEKEMAYVMGASMLVSHEFVRQIGLMREDYFLYFEEIDWAIRARGKFGLGYAPKSRVLHKAQASGRKAVKFSTRYYYRNRIRFTSRFYPENLGKTKRGLLIEMLRHVLKGRWTHVQLIASTLRDARRLAVDAARSA